MSALLDLPRELFLLILSHLARASFRNLITSRRTCAAFNIHVTSMLTNPLAYRDLLLAIHNFSRFELWAVIWMGHIRNLGIHRDGASCLGLPPHIRSQLRPLYLRRDATWRALPLVSERGDIVRRMQFVTPVAEQANEVIGGVNSIIARDVLFHRPSHNLSPSHAQEAASERQGFRRPSGGVTLGEYYDLYVGASLDPVLTTLKLCIWNARSVIFHCRIEDVKDHVWANETPNSWNGTDEEVMDKLCEDPDCAVFYQYGVRLPDDLLDHDLEYFKRYFSKPKQTGEGSPQIVELEKA